MDPHPKAHAAAYREWLLAPLCEAVIATIRPRFAAQRALGDEALVEALVRMVERTPKRPATWRTHGSPK